MGDSRSLAGGTRAFWVGFAIAVVGGLLSTAVLAPAAIVALAAR